MKKILLYTGVVAMILSSCTKDIEEFNKNSKAPEEVPAAMLYANAQKELVYYISSPSVNINTFRLWAQHWTQTTYTDESNYQLTERNINGEVYDRLYADILRDFMEAKAIINADELLTTDDMNAQLALIEILECYSYHVLVDIFNDVPYTDALKLNDAKSPQYDDAETIYNDLVKRLDAAISSLGKVTSVAGIGNSDNIYSGDAASWSAFANALKLKMAVRTGNASWANSALAGIGGFNSAMLAFEGSSPNTNPLWEALVQSGRTDFIASSTIADFLNERNDPRMSVYFRALAQDVNGVDSAVIGAPHGLQSAYNSNSQPGDMLEDPTHPGQLISMAEVEFLQAHAALEGWSTSGTFKSHYEAGVAASFAEWGLTGSETAYLTSKMVSVDSTDGSKTAHMNLLAEQKWVALYDNAFEAWTTWRIYDHPQMAKASEALTEPPFRYNYSIDEYSINETNVSAANGGNDDTMDKVFWDK